MGWKRKPGGNCGWCCEPVEESVLSMVSESKLGSVFVMVVLFSLGWVLSSGGYVMAMASTENMLLVGTKCFVFATPHKGEAHVLYWYGRRKHPVRKGLRKHPMDLPSGVRWRRVCGRKVGV